MLKKNLFAFGSENSLTLVPNELIAQRYKKIYATEQYRLGKTAWPTPNIFSLAIWLENIWTKINDEHKRILLNRHQEFVLWQSIINDSHLVELAQSAWNDLHNYQIALFDLKNTGEPNCVAWQNWAQRFLAICDANHFLDHARLQNVIATAFVKRRLKLPQQKIYLVGFDEISPQFKALLAILEEQDYEIIFPSNPKSAPQPSIKCYTFSDPKTEIISMANWAKNLAKTDNTISIGCIVPSTSQIREIAAVLKDRCYPIDVNIIAPQIISSTPSVASCQTIIELDLTQPLIAKNTLCKLFQSSFIINSQDNLGNAEFEIKLHHSKKSYLTLNDCRNLATHDIIPLINILEQYQKSQIAHCDTLAPPSYWTQFFNIHLQQFCKNIPLNLVKLLQSFAQLDLVLPNLSLANAREYLKNLLLQVETTPAVATAGINILPAAKAPYLHFEHAWIMDVNREKWVAKTSCNPFLPTLLQQKLAMPNSTFESALDTLKKLILHLQNSATNVNCSYTTGSEIEPINIHPLFQQLITTAAPPEEVTIRKGSESLLDLIYRTKKLEVAVFKKAPPLTVIERGKTYNSGVITTQALCPFRAFAEYRLNAKAPRKTEFGIGKSARGELIHHVLEKIWRTLTTRSNLLALTPDALLTLIKNQIKTGVEKMHLNEDPALRSLSSLEAICLTSLITAWLQHEKDRPQFNVIATEQKINASNQYLKFAIRIDRIDQLENKELAVIDYKYRSDNNLGLNIENLISNWQNDQRPNELQLPLYAISYPQPISALMWAKISRLQTNELLGISANNTDLDNVKSVSQVKPHSNLTWQELTNLWRAGIERLSADFAAGNAAVAPKDGKTCQYCALQALCRINES